jgi:hypothetical protein
MDFDGISKVEWGRKFTFGARAWPTAHRPRFFAYEIQPCCLEKISFGSLHIFEKVRKMNETRHIGL